MNAPCKCGRVDLNEGGYEFPGADNWRYGIIHTREDCSKKIRTSDGMTDAQIARQTERVLKERAALKDMIAKVDEYAKDLALKAQKAADKARVAQEKASELHNRQAANNGWLSQMAPDDNWRG